MTDPLLIPFGTAPERAAAADDVAHHLQAGGWIAYATETVYGIGCALLPAPLQALAAAKRPGGHRPFLLLVPGGGEAPGLRWTPEARRLAARFWPGPLTLALEAEPSAYPGEVTAEDGTVAIRDSPHPAVAAIVHALGAPITSTSANVPGEPPARDAGAAADTVMRLTPRPVTWILDSGALPDAQPSTVVRATADGIRILREGAIAEDDLRLALRNTNDE